MTAINRPFVYKFLLLLFGGLLLVYSSNGDFHGSEENPIAGSIPPASEDGEGKETPFPIPDKPLDADFFYSNDLGKTILAYLSCEDFDCEETFHAVVKIGSDAGPPLIRILQYGVPPEVGAKLPGDAQTLVRIRVINALGALADSRALAPIVAALQDSHPLVRAAAAGAVGQIGGHKAVTLLLPLLRDPDQLVRETTAQSLGRLKRPETLPALRSAATDESNPHVRQAIEAAIQVIELQR